MNTTFLGLTVLVIFTATFAVICIWTMWPSHRLRMKAHSEIPLREDLDHQDDWDHREESHHG